MFLKAGSFGNYAYNTTNNNDPRIVKFYMGPHLAIGCNQKTESDGSVTTVCGPNSFPQGQVFSIPTAWSAQSNQIYTAPNGATVPLYIYRSESNDEIYLLNPALNESVLAKMWFKQPEAAKFFTEVYAKEGIRIFKVNHEAVNAPG
jgi:hypothetical protein